VIYELEQSAIINKSILGFIEYKDLIQAFESYQPASIPSKEIVIWEQRMLGWLQEKDMIDVTKDFVAAVKDVFEHEDK